MKIKSISYPIAEKIPEKNYVIIKAGKELTDENKYIHQESFEFKIPKQIVEEEEIKFEVLGVHRKNKDDYFLNMISKGWDFGNVKEYSSVDYSEFPQEAECSVDEICGDVFSQLKLSRSLLRKWLGFEDSREITLGFMGVNFRHTQKILDCLPREIMINREEVVVFCR